MKNHSLNRKKLVGQLREKYPANHVTSLAFADCSLVVKTNSTELTDYLNHYFRPFLSHDIGKAMIEITAHEGQVPEFAAEFTIKKPDPGKTKIKEEFLNLDDGRIVRKRLTGMVFIFGGSDNVAIGPCLENPNQVINFVNNRFINWKLKQGYLLGHAAGVKWSDAGLALAGFSGMGKSTLALHLMSRGTGFVSNDRLLVKSNSHDIAMYGVAKLPRINPGTALNNDNLQGVIPADDRNRFADLPTHKLWDLEHKYDVFIDDAFGTGLFDLFAVMKGLVILNWQRNKEKTVIREVDLSTRPDLLPAFMKETGLFFLPEEKEHELDHSSANYLEMLSHCTVLEISGGVDFKIATDACMDFLVKN
ncbi:MAG: HprK-related kinase B [Desulfobulbaceae bacterium]|nr:HprK-related kinase B [Desulfobulbaceae bacterium]